jgi:poly(A) polymerase/tRNA nucleotidyltransferase (CCA-adding enzyme)
LNIKPSPKIGAILDVLLSEVIEEPELNTLEILEKRAKELDEFNLEELRAKAKEVIEEKREADDQEIKKQYKV